MVAEEVVAEVEAVAKKARWTAQRMAAGGS